MRAFSVLALLGQLFSAARAARFHLQLGTVDEALGLEGQEVHEREKCMKDKVAARPQGLLTSFEGSAFPAALNAESYKDLPRLKTAECEPNGCGLFNYTHPWPAERQSCVREVPKLLHFVWLDHPLKEKYAGNIAGVMRANPKWQLILWINEKSTDYSKLTEMLTADEQAKVHAKLISNYKDRFANWDIISQEPNVGARSDWIRFEGVNLLGGVYMDTDVSVPPHFGKYGGVFRWPFVAYSDFSGYGNLCNCIFSAEKNSSLIQLALKGWREAYLHHGGSSGPVGCLILTSAFKTYNSPEILMLHQKYTFMHETGTTPVMSMSFDASWRKVGQADKVEEAQRQLLRTELLKKERSSAKADHLLQQDTTETSAADLTVEDGASDDTEILLQQDTTETSAADSTVEDGQSDDAEMQLP